MRPRSRISTFEPLDRLLAGCGRRLLDGARTVGARLLAWQQLARERRALGELDQRMLKDIGLRREDARREARRPFWDDERIDRWLGR